MKNKSLFKKAVKILLVSSFLLGAMVPAKVDLQANTVKQYFWSSLYDSGSKKFIAKIIDDDISSPDEGRYSRLDSKEVWFTLKEKPSGKNNIIDSAYTPTTKGNLFTTYSYTFPGTVTSDNQKAAMAQDQQMANHVANTLTSSLNSAIMKIATECKIKTGSMVDKEFLGFATAVVNSAGVAMGNTGSGTGSYTVGRTTCDWRFVSAKDSSKVSEINHSYGKGTKKSDFALLYVEGKDTGLAYQVQAPKGYSAGQHLESTFTGEDISGWMNDRLSWAHVIYQAKYSFANNITADTGDVNNKGSWLEQAIAELFNSIINGLTSILGLFTLDEIMLNTGNRAVEYYEGIMPRGWFVAISIVYVLCMAISLLVIGYSIVKLMIQKNLSTINATQKVGLMEGVKDLAFTAAMLSLFYPAFLIVCKFNSLIVTGLFSIVFDKKPLQELLIGNGGGTGLLLGSIIIACVLLFIALKINITYIIRALTIALLFVTAPFFISTYSIPGKKEKFWSWLKEMLANIFMQSFDAIIAVVLILILNDYPMRVIERLAIGLAVISLSSFFKNSVIRMGSDSEDVAGKASGMIATGLGNTMAGLVRGSSHNAHKNNSQSTGRTLESNDTSGEGGVVNPLAMKNVGDNEFKQTLGGRIDKFKGNVSNLSEKHPVITGVAQGVGHIGKGVGHALGGAVQTGISMGSQAAGGRSFVAEQASAKSFEKAQDEIWDNGIASIGGTIGGAAYEGAKNIFNHFDNPNNEAYFNSEQLKDQAKITNLEKVEADYEDDRGNLKFMNGVETTFEDDTFSKNDALFLAEQYANEDVLFKTTYNKKILTSKDPNGGYMYQEDNRYLTPKQLKQAASSARNSDDNFKIESMVLGGGEYADATVNARNFNVNGQIQTNWELKNQNGENMPLPNVHHQVRNR